VTDQSGVRPGGQRVTIQYHARVHDDEWGSDENRTDDSTQTAILLPSDPVKVIDLSTCAGDEAILRVTLTLELSDGGQVTAFVNSSFSEGVSCGTHDEEDRWTDYEPIDEGDEVFLSHDLHNSGFGGGDYARLQLTIKNERYYGP